MGVSEQSKTSGDRPAVSHTSALYLATYLCCLKRTTRNALVTPCEGSKGSSGRYEESLSCSMARRGVM